MRFLSTMSWSAYLCLVFVVCQFAFTGSAQDQNKSNTCGSCAYDQDLYWGGWWTIAAVESTTSIVAVTVVIVTNASYTVSTSTIYDFPSDAPVPLTNSEGYPIYAKTINVGSSTITTTLTFPTGFVSYQYGVSWSGKVPVSGAPNGSMSASTGRPGNSTSISPRISNSTRAACSTAVTAQFSQYPTPPTPVFPTLAYPLRPESPFQSFDPTLWWQWTFLDYQTPGVDCMGVYDFDVFPSYAAVLSTVPVYEYCSPPSFSICGAVALQTVAYLTTTSHRSDAGEQGQIVDTGGTTALAADTESRSATSEMDVPNETNTPAGGEMKSENTLYVVSSQGVGDKSPGGGREPSDGTSVASSVYGTAQPAGTFEGIAPPTNVVEDFTVFSGSGQQIPSQGGLTVVATAASGPYTEGLFGSGTASTGQMKHQDETVYAFAGSGSNGAPSARTYLLVQTSESNGDGKGTYLVESSWINGRLIKATYLVEELGTVRQHGPATYLIASPQAGGEHSEATYEISVSRAGLNHDEATFVITNSGADRRPIDSTYATGDPASAGEYGSTGIIHKTINSRSDQRQDVGQGTQATIDSITKWQQGDGGGGSSKIGSPNILGTSLTPQTVRGDPSYSVESSGAVRPPEEGCAPTSSTGRLSTFTTVFAVFMVFYSFSAWVT